ncbi:MAG: sugar phosphate nucleotidyltransferase [Candidatus Gracilibacteria bacterium]
MSINKAINKAVLPIAGLGTRFLPFTKVIPKEMLPINGVPILQLLIEEAFEAGITEIVLVINKEKEPIIRSYLSKDGIAATKIAEKGHATKLEHLNQLIDSVKFHYVYQEQQLGDGHAILQAEPLLHGEPFAVLFGDDLVVPSASSNHDTSANALSQLIKAHEKTSSSIIALEEIPIEKSSNYGIIKPKDTSTSPLYEIEKLVEKPAPLACPSNLGIIGKYIVTPEIFESLKSAEKSIGGEIRLIDGFNQLIKTQPIYGLTVEGKRYDTGTLDGYKKAILGAADPQPK